MYRVQLQNFEGPLDLLLFFIRRDELDIYDIPISYVTEQFLEYIQFLEELDLGIASEFIYMASTLMAIKAKMMLPRVDLAEDEFDESDPRFELVQSLLEFKRYKEMGEELLNFDAKARNSYRRSFLEPDIVDQPVDQEPLKDISLFDLIAAYRQILNTVTRDEIVHKVQLAKTNIEERSSFIIDKIRNRGRLTFWQICEDAKHKIVVIITFLAILEMIKDQKLILFVSDDNLDFSIELPMSEKILTQN
jgi:segregation and condensation protein A